MMNTRSKVGQNDAAWWVTGYNVLNSVDAGGAVVFGRVGIHTCEGI